jgi:hypothetical protein
MTPVSPPPRSTAPGQRQWASSRFGRLIITTSDVEFSVVAGHKGEPRPMANAGDGRGIAAIQGNAAIF